MTKTTAFYLRFLLVIFVHGVPYASCLGFEADIIRPSRVDELSCSRIDGYMFDRFFEIEEEAEKDLKKGGKTVATFVIHNKKTGQEATFTRCRELSDGAQWQIVERGLLKSAPTIISDVANKVKKRVRRSDIKETSLPFDGITETTGIVYEVEETFYYECTFRFVPANRQERMVDRYVWHYIAHHKNLSEKQKEEEGKRAIDLFAIARWHNHAVAFERAALKNGTYVLIYQHVGCPEDFSEGLECAVEIRTNFLTKKYTAKQVGYYYARVKAYRDYLQNNVAVALANPLKNNSQYLPMLNKEKKYCKTAESALEFFENAGVCRTIHPGCVIS